MLRNRFGFRRVLATSALVVLALGVTTAAAYTSPRAQAEDAPVTTTTTIDAAFAAGTELGPGNADWSGVAALVEAGRQERLAQWYAAAAENERLAAEAAAQAAAREVARQEAAVAARNVAPARDIAQPAAPSPAPSGSGDRWGSTGSVGGYPCGGALPSCRVLACESGGNPSAENPTSSASGLWQIIDGTWGGYGGYSHASYAPWDVQNDKAAALWAGGAGRSHWRSCL